MSVVPVEAAGSDHALTGPFDRVELPGPAVAARQPVPTGRVEPVYPRVRTTGGGHG